MFEALLVRLARALDAAGVPYMVIGGQAVLFYGEARFTKDVDLTLGVGPDALENLLVVCKNAGLRVLAANPEEFVTRTMVLPCEDATNGTRVDLVFSTSAFERESIQRASIFHIDGTAIRVVSIESLIVHKVVAGRPRDLEDVRLLAARHQDLDRAAIEQKLGEFSQALEEDFVRRFRGALHG